VGLLTRVARRFRASSSLSAWFQGVEWRPVLEWLAILGVLIWILPVHVCLSCGLGIGDPLLDNVRVPSETFTRGERTSRGGLVCWGKCKPPTLVEELRPRAGTDFDRQCDDMRRAMESVNPILFHAVNSGWDTEESAWCGYLTKPASGICLLGEVQNPKVRPWVRPNDVALLRLSRC